MHSKRLEDQFGEACDILSTLRDGPLSEEMANRIDRLLNGEFGSDDADEDQGGDHCPVCGWEKHDEGKRCAPWCSHV